MISKEKIPFNFFKRIIVNFLMLMLAIIIVVSTGYVGWTIIDKLVIHFDPSSISNVIIDILGLFLLVFVSLELFETFKLYTQEHVVHVEAMLLVALIAISRKIILLDYNKITSDIFFGLSALVISIGTAYYLLKKTWIATIKA
ncbi:MAG: phosphate-starvation-inducible PsiE family protein [Candidatus Thermoplasmatota archaeon]